MTKFSGTDRPDSAGSNEPTVEVGGTHSTGLQGSVLDRLRGKMSAATKPAIDAPPARTSESPSPEPVSAIKPSASGASAAASMRDLAAEIKRARPAEIEPKDQREVEKPASLLSASDEPGDSAPRPPAVSESEEGDQLQRWRNALARTVSATRDDLQEAHQTVAELRRRMQEAEVKRKAADDRIATGLDNAESLLAEIRDAWR